MSLPKLRHQDHYIAVTRELREAGYVWTEESGGKHARLVVDVGAREETIIMSVSPSDHRAAANAVGDIRRRIRSWKAEAAEAAAPDLFQTMEVAGTMDLIPSAPTLTMSSIEVAELLEVRHDSVKRTIERLVKKGTIELPPAVEVRNHLGQSVAEYRICKRDSYIVVAQLSPEFTAKIVDRWQELEGREAQRMAVGDDIGAILDVMSDGHSGMVRAVQSSAGTALEHIDGAKAAVLHYLKAYLREPADAFHEDVRHRHVAAYKRDHQVISVLGELSRRIGDLIAIAGPMISERPFLWSEWYDAARIYAEHFPGRVIPKKGFLSTAIARGLDSHCKQTRKFHHMEQRVVGGHPRNFWHKDAVWAWLEAGGRDLVEAHIHRHTPSANIIQIGSRAG